MLAIVSRIHAAAREILWGPAPPLPAVDSAPSAPFLPMSDSADASNIRPASRPPGLLHVYALWRPFVTTDVTRQGVQEPSQQEHKVQANLATQEGGRADLYAWVCALRGFPSGMDTHQLDQVRALLEPSGHEGLAYPLPTSLGLVYDHQLALGGVPWLYDLRYSFSIDNADMHNGPATVSLPPSPTHRHALSHRHESEPRALPWGDDDDDDLGEVVDA